MKKIITSVLILLFSSTISYADYSNNPNCRGYGIIEIKERKKCLEANPVVKDSKNKVNVTYDKINVDTSGIRNKTGNFFKKLGVNTDSKLLKTGKYSENK
mgnify:CR=1 FL=1|tara:strand:- start:385 stop:684 length:300 start_codon:yes stop_codon:yes gene_type:complete